MKSQKYTMHKLSALLIVAVAVTGVQAELYPDVRISGPVGVDLSSFDSFDPPVSNYVPHASAPGIAEWTRSNQPGDTMVLTGEKLSYFTDAKQNAEGYTAALRSDGVDDYVLTGIKPNPSLSFEVDGIWPGDIGGWYQMGHGAKWIDHSQLYLGGSSEGFGFSFGGNSLLSTFKNNGFRNVLYVDRTKYGVNGEYVAWSPATTFSHPVPIKLFKLNANYNPGFFETTIFRATIKNIDTGEVLLNAIAQEDGTLYDTVTGTVLANSGSGAFTEVKYGMQVSRTPGKEGRDTRFVLFGQDGATGVVSDGLIQRLDGQRCAVTLPENLPGKFFLMWPRNAKGYGKPVAINKPQGWYVLPKYLSKGDAFSVYGRNLVADKDSPASHVYVAERDEWLDTATANSYKADYAIPAGWPNGTYTLWPHNGTGGKYGWGEPVTVIVDDVLDFSGGTVRNVKTTYGAEANGVANDTSAIAEAFSAASAGDTIYFPKGTYAISESLPHINNLRILGDGMDSTTITTHSTFSGTYGDAAFINWIHQSEVKDIEFNVGDYKSVNDVILWPQANQRNDRLHCDGVRFTMESTTIGSTAGSLLELSHINNCTFRNCEIITGKNIYCGGSSNMLFETSDFYGMLDVGLLVLNWGGENVSMTDCTAQNLDDSDARSYKGWCQGRVFHGAGAYGSCRNMYFGDCTTSNLTPRLPAAWVTSTPSAVTANSFTFTPAQASQVDDCIINKCAVITSGTGAGRAKYYISSINKSTGLVTLRKNWTATGGGKRPDITSTIRIDDPIPNRNTGEQFMFEFTDTQFRGYAESATASTVVFSTLTNNYNGEVVAIVGGRGLGQSRVISGDSSSGTVTVSEDWNVVPDATSLMMIGAYLYRAAVVNNYLDGTTLAVEDDAHVAVEGVSTFGGSFDVCVEDNTFHKMRNGISTWGLICAGSDYFPKHYLYNPNYFNHFADNLFDGCRNGIRNRTKVWDEKRPVINDLALLGSVYRRNTMKNLFSTAFTSATTESNTWEMTVFDQNVVDGGEMLNDDDTDAIGFTDIPSAAANQIWIGNSFTNGSSVGLIVRYPHVPVFRGNTWAGFFDEYAGDLPGPVLEIPCRVVEVSGGIHEFEIFNSGTDELDWRASISPSNSWVSILNPTGRVPKTGRATIGINADTSMIYPYDKAIITISDGLQAKQVTIIYNPAAKPEALEKSGTKFPLSGFEGETLRVELYIGNSENPRIFGPWKSPDEINLEGLSSHPWRKIIISSYDPVTRIWDPVWINWAG